MSGRGLRGLLAVMSLEVEAAGVAMGAGVYQMLRPSGCFGIGRTTGPVVYAAYQDALQSAWSDVVRRLEVDAARMEAHWVLGVAVSPGWVGGSGAVYEIKLIGSAVRVRGRGPVQRPLLSTLSMPDFLKLQLGGWVPCGITWGVAAVHVHAWEASPFVQRTSFRNAEMDGPTEGVLTARRLLGQQARANMPMMKGVGAVDMSMTLQRIPQKCTGASYRNRFGSLGGNNDRGLLIDGRVLGTAVARFGDPVASPTAVLDLLGSASP